jgi:hypothetical protein
MIVYFLNGNTNEIEYYYAEKEYRDDIILEINDLYYEVYFFTIDALEYEMTKDGYFAHPCMIILDEISTEKIIKAITELKKRGFFKRFQGMTQLNQEKRFIHEWYSNKLSLYDMSKMRTLKLS